jgi:hypothetical protein
MNVDKAPANLLIHWINRSGDTGRRRVEYRNKYVEIIST